MVFAADMELGCGSSHSVARIVRLAVIVGVFAYWAFDWRSALPTDSLKPANRRFSVELYLLLALSGQRVHVAHPKSFLAGDLRRLGMNWTPGNADGGLI